MGPGAGKTSEVFQTSEVWKELPAGAGWVWVGHGGGVPVHA